MYIRMYTPFFIRRKAKGTERERRGKGSRLVPVNMPCGACKQYTTYYQSPLLVSDATAKISSLVSLLHKDTEICTYEQTSTVPPPNYCSVNCLGTVIYVR